jgi:hypothetical protein
MDDARKDLSARGERSNADAARIADALQRRGRISIRVHGTSMLPLLRPGDVALIRKETLENVRAGDVLLVRRGNHLVAKRVGADEDSFSERTLGGTGDRDSAPGQLQECLGKIVRVYRQSEEIDLAAWESLVSDPV